MPTTTYTVIKQPRASGPYYSAIIRAEGSKSTSITLGYIAGDPPPMTLTTRLRNASEIGPLDAETIKAICLAPTDDAAVSVMLRATGLRLVPSDLADLGTESPPATPAPPVNVPGGPVGEQGAMTLRRYVAEVWTPKRRKQEATWEHEEWRWEARILPALGDVRLVDLDAEKWSTFMGTLKCGGRAKALIQTAYRCALRHAASKSLKWIPSVHEFDRIEGSTLRTLAEPKPLNADEITRFLDAAPSPTHRALFGLQIGQGLRPREVIRVSWPDIDFEEKTLFVSGGTKNALARAKIGLTPLAYREMHAYWIKRGKPTRGIAFERVRGGGPFPAYPRTAFRSTAKKSKLNEGRTRKLFPYLARHTFATMAAEMGIDRAFTKDMMRHSKKSTVLEEAYERVSKAATADAFAAFDVPAKAV